ncbi:putative Heterokaryon incompatibility domain-containing protein [Seiridium unicorne]|uniref:Heterokaryon incompatibility domain-containing protein n=1 Tax=Seiridium unicorne TaxID=138068 RepID=A0ABR2VIE4_9PEZI
MRLIDTHTHLLLEPWKAADKEYAILSHTWGAEEVVFQEWEQLFPSGAIKGQCPHVRHARIKNKAGYHKVMQACEQAKRDGIRWLWCDTMCINKESSAELSEAINSMFEFSNWYSDAKTCYAYLIDVQFPDRNSHLGVFTSRSNVPGWFPHAIGHKQDSLVRELKSSFLGSRWWTRGWTLQELLAPNDVVFFAVDWTPLGCKTDVAPWISTSTNIHQSVLEDRSIMRNFSIAQRMSWVSRRRTTMVEDMAYCLLGIFDINMPMLYGQGEKAFQKLQEEIIKVSDDQSIFAWSSFDPQSSPWTGILAKSPEAFQDSGSIICDDGLVKHPYAMTNLGLRIRVPVIPNDKQKLYYIGLNCSFELRGKPRKTRRDATMFRSRRRFQVWIITRCSGDNMYERGHMPMSMFYFQQSYSLCSVPAAIELFLMLSASQNRLAYPSTLLATPRASCSGILVAFGFGNMREISGAYLDSWEPLLITDVSVGSRSHLGSSHKVISCGSFTIIISIQWDVRSEPQQHFCTILHDPCQQILNMLGAQDSKDEDSLLRRPVEASCLHDHIRVRFSDDVADDQSNDVPLVIFEDEPLQNLFGHSEIALDITFKERRRKT